jgi:hypothetical protein
MEELMAAYQCMPVSACQRVCADTASGCASSFQRWVDSFGCFSFLQAGLVGNVSDRANFSKPRYVVLDGYQT